MMEAIRFYKDGEERYSKVRGYMVPDMDTLAKAALVAHTLGQTEIRMYYGRTTRLGWFTRVNVYSTDGHRVKFIERQINDRGLI